MKRSKQDPGSSEAEDTSRHRNRRQALALGGAAAAAAAVAALGVNGGKKAHAATGDPLILGQGNDANPGDVTELTAAVNTVSFRVTNPEGGGFGGAIEGEAYVGAGVKGSVQYGAGVFGWTAQGSGVSGISESGIGVYGISPGDTPAVHAESADPKHPGPGPGFDGGVALRVIGKASFATAGAGVVPAQARSVEVAPLWGAVTANSHITVTFTADPARASVAWVERDPGVGFTVHLSGRPRSDVPFTYLIVEPVS